jgi:hypothetical protein
VEAVSLVGWLEALAFAGQVVSAVMMLFDWRRRRYAASRRWAVASLLCLAVVLAVEPQP